MSSEFDPDRYRRAIGQHGPKHAHTRHLLHVLAARSEPDGSVTMAHSELQRELCVSKPTIIAALDLALVEGWLTRPKRSKFQLLDPTKSKAALLLDDPAKSKAALPLGPKSKAALLLENPKSKAALPFEPKSKAALPFAPSTRKDLQEEEEEERHHRARAHVASDVPFSAILNAWNERASKTPPGLAVAVPADGVLRQMIADVWAMPGFDDLAWWIDWIERLAADPVNLGLQPRANGSVRQLDFRFAIQTQLGVQTHETRRRDSNSGRPRSLLDAVDEAADRYTEELRRRGEAMADAD